MADKDNAAATATAQPVPPVNGFERLSAPASAPAAAPAAGARAPAANAEQPAWPDHDDEAPPPSTSAPAPSRQPDATPFDAVQFEAARQVLQDALVAEATGAALDPDLRARQELDRGNGRHLGLALRVIASQARARAGAANPTGQALTEAGIGVAAAHLDLIAGRLAQAGGFALPDLIVTAAEQPDVAQIRAATDAMFDSLTEQRLHAAGAQVPRPSAELVDEGFPLDIPRTALRSPAALAWRVQQFLRTEHQAPVSPQGLRMALVVADQVLTGPLPTEPSATQLAQLVVGADPAPLHTAARLRQLSDYLAQQLPAGSLPPANFAAERVASFTQYLPVLAAAIERASADPVLLPTARMAALFDRAVVAPPPGVRPTADTAPPRPAAQNEPAATESAAPGPSGQNTPDTYDPDLLAEHALLGSLIHAPAALADLDFLGPRDFSRTDTRTVYVTLRQLYQEGALIDVAAMPTQAQQLDAAQENYRRLYVALRAHHATRDSVSNIPQLIGLMTRAAPPRPSPFAACTTRPRRSRWVGWCWRTPFGDN